MTEINVSNKVNFKITINDEKVIEAESGKSLLSSLRRQKIHIPTSCGGKGKCGLCKLKVFDMQSQLTPAEEILLDKEEKKSNIRLSCQVKIQSDLKIIIPQEILDVKEFSCKCLEVTDLTYDIKRFKFQIPASEKISYTPGQYMQLTVPAYEKSKLPITRAYSIATNPNDTNCIEFVIRRVPNGISTGYLFDYLKIGEMIRIKGPFGQFKLSETDVPIIFIAGGSGMSPIKCILHQMKNTGNKRKAIYYFGANKVKDLFYVELMEQFEKELPNFRFVPAVASPDNDENWSGKTGLVTEVVREDLQNASESEAYLCGSPGMIDSSIKVLKELGTKEENIFYDKFE